jgi:RimJ/RimL family protein N-acetyltransferase
MIVTDRLELVPADSAHAKAALAGNAALGQSLQATVPSSWPPHFVDPTVYRTTLEGLAVGPSAWSLHFIVLKQGRVVVGTCGYRGAPTSDGTVRLGYAVVPDHQRHGYASEAVRGLVSNAFAASVVRRAIAETAPDSAAAVGVLRKCGFEPLKGMASEPGTVRFELVRP